jgi:hypothetical protein
MTNAEWSKSHSVYNILSFYRSGEGNFDTRGALDIDTSSAMEVGTRQGTFLTVWYPVGTKSVGIGKKKKYITRGTSRIQKDRQLFTIGKYKGFLSSSPIFNVIYKFASPPDRYE